jgi:hypothetical protein
MTWEASTRTSRRESLAPDPAGRTAAVWQPASTGRAKIANSNTAILNVENRDGNPSGIKVMDHAPFGSSRLYRAP